MTPKEDRELTVFPKVTSAMMRSQLDNINMTLAELKRSRLELKNGISNYESAIKREQQE